MKKTRIISAFTLFILSSMFASCLESELDKPFDPASKSFFLRTLIAVLEDSESNAGCNPCRVFIYDLDIGSGTDGDIGGPAAADALCLNNENNPEGAGQGQWKALLVDGVNRRACTDQNCESADGLEQSLDWVLHADTEYQNLDGDVWGISNENGIITDFTTAVLDPGPPVWTGFQSNWVTAAETCADWTDVTGDGRVGASDATDITAISFNNQACNQSFFLYCVEQ